MTVCLFVRWTVEWMERVTIISCDVVTNLKVRFPEEVCWASKWHECKDFEKGHASPEMGHGFLGSFYTGIPGEAVCMMTTCCVPETTSDTFMWSPRPLDDTDGTWKAFDNAF